VCCCSVSTCCPSSCCHCRTLPATQPPAVSSRMCYYNSSTAVQPQQSGRRIVWSVAACAGIQHSGDGGSHQVQRGMSRESMVAGSTPSHSRPASLNSSSHQTVHTAKKKPTGRCHVRHAMCTEQFVVTTGSASTTTNTACSSAQLHHHAANYVCVPLPCRCGCGSLACCTCTPLSASTYTSASP
jgi:hypothetical protein